MTIYIWNEHIDKILCVGRPLADLGVRNYALSQSESLIALSLLNEMGVAILGGDVYALNENSIEETYDSWHCDQDKLESDKEFLKRSIAISLNYIQTYSKSDALFSLIPKSGG